MQKNVTPVSLLALYKLFFGVGLFSFGGGLTAWFHREVVLVRGWMTNDEFFSGYSLAQLLPGVNSTNMNHGFAVDRTTLPTNAVETHVSLFDGSNCGIALKDKPVFSVQYHPEASPGPRDSRYLFQRFVGLMKERKRA